ncbi:MAG: sulfate/thiosulfate transport system substrate-binding protein [Fimbriimonadaceae bacterium]|jgi:sulfate transport system substrate-binding protein|nr:sulfate/thiosulfate transport system substrate-binding protein [Fimbriimonadaceae bacterium]
MKFVGGLSVLMLAAGIVTLSSCGKSAEATKTVTITLAGNSVARGVYENGLIPAFKDAYAKAHPGEKVEFRQTYEGSGAQTRAILAGLKADVAALTLAPEMEKLAAAGLVAKDWAAASKGGSPATSVVVIVVRPGNPKKIHDWPDLTRQDVDVVFPNPETSGAAQWNVAAIYGAYENALATGTVDDLSNPGAPNSWHLLRDIRHRTKVFGKSGREAMQIFSSGVGDALVGWECEALERKAAGDQLEIVYPTKTIRMEPPVAVVIPKGQVTNGAAVEFVQFLTTPEAQRIYAEHHFRPRDADVAKEAGSDLPAVTGLFGIDDIGGWAAVQKVLFGPEGLWAKAGQ